MFPITEITHRFQTARVEVQALLLQCLQPWLENMELVAASVPPATPLSYIVVSYASVNARICQHTRELGVITFFILNLSVLYAQSMRRIRHQFNRETIR